jgi:hypothetical protein
MTTSPDELDPLRRYDEPRSAGGLFSSGGRMWQSDISRIAS